MADLSTLEILRVFLGVAPDDETDQIIERERAAALREIQRVTGVDWSVIDENEDADELLRDMVYMAYYGTRDGSADLSYLERRISRLTKQLQCSAEALDGI